MTDPHNNPPANGDDRCPDPDVHREIHEWASDESLTTTILTALADVKDVETTELEPLYESIDPDALEALFDPDGDGLRTDGHVSFSLGDYAVTIHGHGEFAVVSLKKSPQSVDFRQGGGWKMEHAAAFESALQDLVQTAARNGVLVTGGWPVESPSTALPNWDVHITEVSKPEEE